MSRSLGSINRQGLMSPSILRGDDRLSTTGLPIGSHFMAAPGEDRMLYELAFELEAAMPWGQRWAPHSAMQLAR
jgi:amidase